MSSDIKYRPDIDGLRAIAVGLVVIYHAFPSIIRAGYIGVDVFFVISGYLITSIILRQIREKRFSFKSFYVKRINRIFPALILMLLTSSIIGWFTLFSDELSSLGKHISSGAGFVSNIVLWKESGYFDTSSESKPLLHLWSLSLEEQFYIIWPFLLFYGAKKNLKLLTIILFFFMCSFALNVSRIQSHPVSTFYLLPTRFWELLIGSALAYMSLFPSPSLKETARRLNAVLSRIIFEVPDHKRDMLRDAMSVLGLLLILIAAISFKGTSSFPGYRALLPTVGSFLIISAGQNAWVNKGLLSLRPMIWLGIISYPLYLWHWPLLSFLRIVTGQVPAVEMRILSLIISMILAWLTYRLIEVPLRNTKSKYTHWALVLLLVLCASAGSLAYFSKGFPSRPIAKLGQGLNYQVSNNKYEDCRSSKEFEALKIGFCTRSTKKDTTAVIIGDSHAEDKLHGLFDQDKDRSWMILGNNSCAPVLGTVVEGDQKDCDKKMAGIIDWVNDNPRIKTVVLSFYGHYFLTTSYSADHIQSKIGPEKVVISRDGHVSENREELFYLGLKDAIQILLRSGKDVVLAVDTPELPFFPRDCIRTFKNCVIDKDEVINRNLKHKEMLLRLNQEFPRIRVFDPLSLFCNETSCTFKKDGELLYRDSHHLSLPGSFLYGRLFLNWLEKGEFRGSFP